MQIVVKAPLVDSLWLQIWFRPSLAIIWRYRPTPESSDGAGEANGLLVTASFGVELVCEVLRVRFAPGVGDSAERVLPSQAGLVTVALA